MAPQRDPAAGFDLIRHAANLRGQLAEIAVGGQRGDDLGAPVFRDDEQHGALGVFISHDGGDEVFE